MTTFTSWDSELYHHGIKGQKWGIRRFQNPDGSLTEEGLRRYGEHADRKGIQKSINKDLKAMSKLTKKALVAQGRHERSSSMKESEKERIKAENLIKQRDEIEKRANDKMKVASDRGYDIDGRNKLVVKSTAKGRDYVRGSLMGAALGATLYTNINSKYINDYKELVRNALIGAAAGALGGATIANRARTVATIAAKDVKIRKKSN